ncbi:hypothetical protein [Alloactinosynnema sp. L-07]|uniref:hypothetical protein n=1 Tax=Alloactinosynnema sp. L-07 TaxID=1653480 RepID=UPI00065F0A36|nr:hypothetical protein [Alloactinosynnema sp. L-07]CRK60500.1 hypothetical protein [Alloactinosynnema sp. L-07]
MTARTTASLWSAVVTAGSVVIVLIALNTAAGVINLGNSNYEVEFIDTPVLGASLLLVPLLGLAAHRSVPIALLGLVGLVVPLVFGAWEAVRRYKESEWGDGLEVLGYVIPIGIGTLGLVAVWIGELIGRRAATLTH